MTTPGRRERLDEAALGEALAALPAWSRDGDALVRSIKRRDWTAAIELVVAIAEEADRRDHHPDLCVRDYRHVDVRLTTHSAGGITELDVELARRIDELAGEASSGDRGA